MADPRREPRLNRTLRACVRVRPDRGAWRIRVANSTFYANSLRAAVKWGARAL